MDLRLSATVRGRPCAVSVEVATNNDPEAVGAPPHAAGFPVGTAVVSTDLAGYDAVMGWIQLVGTQAENEASITYELDPLEIFDGVDTPFGTHGIAPVLFDAPSRRDRSVRLSWRAQSFLCVSEPHPMSRRIVSAAAFEWGFDTAPGEVALAGPSPLDSSAWVRHLPLPARSHPSWTFGPRADA